MLVCAFKAKPACYFTCKSFHALDEVLLQRTYYLSKAELLRYLFDRVSESHASMYSVVDVSKYLTNVSYTRYYMFPQEAQSSLTCVDGVTFVLFLDLR